MFCKCVLEFWGNVIRIQRADNVSYPEKIINMFNMLKGTDNLKEYDRICEIICKENSWPFVRSSAITDAKYGAGRNILDVLQSKKAETKPLSSGSVGSHITPNLAARMQQFLPHPR